MKTWQKFAVSTSFIPLLLIAFIASINLQNEHKIRILLWESPPIKIGLLLTLSYFSATLISATSIILLNSKPVTLRRKVKVRQQAREDFDQVDKTIFDEYNHNSNPDKAYYQKTQRDPRETSPTVEVSYRFINKTSNQNEDYSNELRTDNEMDEYIETKTSDNRKTVNINYVENNDWEVSINDEW